MTIATVCSRTYLFLGAERTSTIFVFDITDPLKPVLQSHISAAGNTDMTPQEAFDMFPEPRPNVNMGQVRHCIVSLSRAFEAGKRIVSNCGSSDCAARP